MCHRKLFFIIFVFFISSVFADGQPVQMPQQPQEQVQPQENSGTQPVEQPQQVPIEPQQEQQQEQPKDEPQIQPEAPQTSELETTEDVSDYIFTPKYPVLIPQLHLIENIDALFVPEPTYENMVADFDKFIVVDRIVFKTGMWNTELAEGAVGEGQYDIGGTTDLLSVPSADKGLIGIDLPWESRLAMSGRKAVTLKYNNIRYLGERPTGTTSTPVSSASSTSGTGSGTTPSGFGIEQELQVRLQGNVGKRVTVNVDYDDTKEQQRDISILYKGQGEELIQEAAFGDITLSLPNTEFTGYNKKIFGAELKAKYKNFYLTAIGAQTKGKTKTVTFKGGYSQIKTDIQDTSYIKNKYFSIQMSNPHLPITAGSEQIWMDDMVGNNNNYPPGYPATRGTDQTAYTQKTEPSATNSFDYMHPGTDYTIDYTTGVITFNKSIASNYKLAVAYRYAGGSVGYASTGTFDFNEATMDSHSIQTGSLDISHQLVNYYNLGNKKILPKELDQEFVFRLSDANNQEIDINKFPYTIDIDFGILKFSNNKPFEKDTSGNSFPSDQNAYHTTSPTNRYTMHIEYKYKFRTYQLPNFNIVKYSEKIYMDGSPLTRELDYTIDYESGFLLFYSEEKITDRTEITATYEYMPFGGQFQSNLFGARGEYFFADKISLGSTFLYTGAQKPPEVPAIGSTSSSLNIYDADTKINFTPEQFEYIAKGLGVSKDILPSDVGFAAEVAQSVYNPNTYDSGDEKGIALVDNMEGVDNVSGFSTSRTTWFSASMPAHDATLTKNNRADIISVDEVEDYGHDTSSTAGKKQLLNMGYNFTSGSWDAVRYVISKSGVDYTRFNYLEMWVNTDWSKNIDFNIDLGVINEDINANGTFDTEDTYGDGQLHQGSDNGISVGAGGGKIYNVGINNNRLDTEDMDGNGRLDQLDSYYTYKFNALTLSSSIVSRDLGPWKLIKIPLSSFSAANAGIPPTDKRLIKSVRIWLKSSSALTGAVTMESINVTGNKWEVKASLSGADKFDIKAINRDIDANYIPVTGTYFKTTTDSVTEENREQSLSVSYTHSNENYKATKVYTKSQNFLEYDNLRFDIFKRTTYSGDVFFIRLGADESNYYQYNVLLDNVSAGSWQRVTVPLDGSVYARSTTGTPFLNNIKQISIGVVSSSASDGEIWINNIRTADPKQRIGIAKRIGGSMKFNDYFGIDMDYRVVDSRFTLLEDSSTNVGLSSSQSYLSTKQTTKGMGINTTAKPVDYIPISASWKRDELVTEESDKDDPNYTQIPEKRIDDYRSTIGFKKLDPFIISVEGSYKEENLWYMPRATTLDNTKNMVDSLGPKATYSLPEEILSVPIGKNDFEASYKYTQEKSKHERFKDKDTYAATREEYAKWTGLYEPTEGLNVSPNYSHRYIDRKGALTYNVYSASGGGTVATSDNFEPQTHTRAAGLTTSYTYIDGFTPKGTYGANVNRDYPRDELRTENSLEGATEFRFEEWWDFLEYARPTLNYSHKITSNALYDKYSTPQADRENKSTLEQLKLMDVWGVWPREDYTLNSAQIITDSLNNRFRIGAFTFNPRGSISNERNRQNKTLTKTNTLSAGGSVNWDSPAFFRNFLNPTSWNNEYNWRRVIRWDANDKITSTDISNTASSILSFKPTDVLSGNLSMAITFDDKDAGSVITRNRRYSPGIELNQDLYFAHPIILPNFWPFNGVSIKLEQKLRVTENFKVDIARNKTEGTSQSSETKTNLYTGGLKFRYNLSQHVVIDISTQGNWFRDEITVGNSYDSFNVMVTLNAIF